MAKNKNHSLFLCGPAGQPVHGQSPSYLGLLLAGPGFRPQKARGGISSVTLNSSSLSISNTGKKGNRTAMLTAPANNSSSLTKCTDGLEPSFDG